LWSLWTQKQILQFTKVFTSLHFDQIKLRDRMTIFVSFKNVILPKDSCWNELYIQTNCPVIFLFQWYFLFILIWMQKLLILFSENSVNKFLLLSFYFLLKKHLRFQINFLLLVNESVLPEKYLWMLGSINNFIRLNLVWSEILFGKFHFLVS